MQGTKQDAQMITAEDKGTESYAKLLLPDYNYWFAEAVNRGTAVC